MNLIKINGKSYIREQLSKDTLEKIYNILFVDAEIKKLRANAAVLQTARIAYGKALKAALADVPSTPQTSV